MLHHPKSNVNATEPKDASKQEIHNACEKALNASIGIFKEEETATLRGILDSGDHWAFHEAYSECFYNSTATTWEVRTSLGPELLGVRAVLFGPANARFDATMRAIVDVLGDKLSQADRAEIFAFVDHGEYRLAMDLLLYTLVVPWKEVNPELASEILDACQGADPELMELFKLFALGDSESTATSA